MSFSRAFRPFDGRLVLAGFTAGALLAVPGAIERANAQPADCAVIGPAANAVCSNPELSSLSDELLGAMRELIRTSPVDFRPNVMADHRDWSIGLRGCLGGPDSYECLYRSYEDRISEVGAAIASQANAPVAPGVPGAPGFPPDPTVQDGSSFAGQIPVEQGTLPPPPGSAPPVVTPLAPDSASNPALGAPAVAAAPDAPVGPDTSAPAPAAGETPPSGGAAGEIAAAAGANAPPAEAPGEDGGEFRSAAATPAAPTPTSGDGGPSAMLVGAVWKAEIASGVRPGTIFVFRNDGSLITADCVDSYRIGSWRVADSTLTMHEGNRSEQTAQIMSIQDNFVRLQMAGTDGRGSTLVLRPAEGPFSCSSS